MPNIIDRVIENWSVDYVMRNMFQGKIRYLPDDKLVIELCDKLQDISRDYNILKDRFKETDKRLQNVIIMWESQNSSIHNLHMEKIAIQKDFDEYKQETEKRLACVLVKRSRHIFYYFFRKVDNRAGIVISLVDIRAELFNL